MIQTKYSLAPNRVGFILPSEMFWLMVKETAQPLTRLGISMSDVAMIAGEAMASQDRYDVVGPALSSRSESYQRVHHIEHIRSFLSGELVTLFPDLLSDKKQFDQLVFSMIDCIAQMRAHLCDYAQRVLELPSAPPSLRLERFLGPQHDLVFSYESPQPTQRPYENPDTARNAGDDVAADEEDRSRYGF